MISKVAASVAVAISLAAVNAAAALRDGEYRRPVLPPLSIGKADYRGHPATGDDELGAWRQPIIARAGDGADGRPSRLPGLVAWTNALHASSTKHELRIERLDRHPIDVEPEIEMERLLRHPESGDSEHVSVSPVPLPAGAWLLVSGLLGLGYLRRQLQSTCDGAA